MVLEPAKVGAAKTISAIRLETWEAINRALLASARQARVEDGNVVRLDSTVTAAPIHEPSDSSLLWDAVRVMVRLLKQADPWVGSTGLEWRDHSRAAKKRARQIQFTRGCPNRAQLYRELIAIARTTLAYLRQATARLTVTTHPLIELWQAQVCRYRPLIERIIRQSERRVLAGEPVSAGEKLVSLFEPHADIIVKGSRAVAYRTHAVMSQCSTEFCLVPCNLGSPNLYDVCRASRAAHSLSRSAKDRARCSRC